MSELQFTFDRSETSGAEAINLPLVGLGE